MPDNAIVIENARTDGVMSSSYWDVEHTTQIEGFATDISVNAGEQIDFKINVNGDAGSDYLVEVFRMGYYGGAGARKVAEWTNTDAVVQPDAAYDTSRGLVDAGNWSVTDSWQTPADAVSGVYLARLQRLDADGNPIDGAVNQLPFIIREDDRDSDIVLQTSDTTWHAYNGWFANNGEIGANFYGDASGTIDHPDIPGAGFFAQDRAYAVSYNRPLITRGIEGQQGGPAAGAQDYLFGADYAAIHWLEQNGYDVSYMSGLDTDRLGGDYISKYDAFISVGHDEYWSGDQRLNVETARDAGTNLLFWGGNDIYWKTRWETSIVDGVEYRTLVCYKETWATLDPAAGPDDYPNLDPADIWTGTWRDTRFEGNPLAGVGYDDHLLSGQPHTCNCAENALTGQLFGPDATGEFGGALDIPAEFAPLRVWRDTSIANGGALDLSPGILGYEWNTSPDDDLRPAGLIHLSETTIPWSRILTDVGNVTEPGVATHNLSLYRAESGALVFGAGTVFWTWALSDEHDGEPYDAQIENTDLQQFVVNMFADMGIQPGVADAVLASQNLVRATASTDTVAATATFDALPGTLPALQAVTLTGTATDDDGNAATDDGLVAAVEVSLDGGATWKLATGTTTWSYSFLPFDEGPLDIRVRAIDDSLNMPATGALDGGTVDVTEPDEPEFVSLFSPWTEFDGSAYSGSDAIQLGTTFIPTQLGDVTELRYYRGADDATDTDVRTGRLWNADGTLLATVTFTSAPNETGWQTAALATPVTLMPGQQYIVAYETLDNYVATQAFFADPYTDPYGILNAPGQNNGVFVTGTGDVMPTGSFQASNYWVDVTFAPAATDNTAPTITSPSTFTVSENAVLAGTVTATDPESNTIYYTIAGGADAALFSIDASTGALNFEFPPDFEAPADSDGDNVYELIVSATDIVDPPVQQAITVTVTDTADESGQLLSTLFAPADTPGQIVTNDATDYELGTRFTTTSSGAITSLRYYRGAADAGDVDTRTLHLWDVSGAVIASAVVSSGQGETGWQSAALSTPINVSAGETFTVSYGTTQNYAVTQNYFTTAQTSAGGGIEAPASAGGAGNGVFSANSTGGYPTASYQASNYWVDVTFAAQPEVNDPPVIGSTSFNAAENQTVAANIAAIDPDGDDLIFAVTGGADAGQFILDPETGLLTFIDAPDFEAPADADADNIYEVGISVSDGTNPAVTANLTISVTDIVNEPSGAAWSLFSSADTPDQTATSDPTDYELGVRFVAAEDGLLTSLRYYRGTADAGDTDTRTLNLWDAAGTNLGNVEVVSTPGQVGWQTGTLATAVEIDAGSSYIASYGTEQNYTYSSSFFTSAWTSDDGMLIAPASTGGAGNGVFNASGPGLFPTGSYNATNYWVDVMVEPLEDDVQMLSALDSALGTTMQSLSDFDVSL